MRPRKKKFVAPDMKIFYYLGNKILPGVISFCLLLVILFTVSSAAAQTQETKKILVLPSYNINYLGSQWFLQGVFAEMKENAPFAVTYYHENLQLAAKPSNEKYFATMAEALKIKYASEKPDLIIVQYKQALEFIANYGKDIFGETPVVFAGLELENYRTIVLPDYFQGITVSFNAKRNIDLILKNHPATKKIYIVAGMSSSEQEMVAGALRQGADYGARVELIPLNGFSFEKILDKIGRLENNAAVIYFSLQIDAEGKIYVPAEAAKKIAEHANAPVYGMLDTYMGSGIVGGFLLNHELLGRRTAKRAIEILSGNGMTSAQIMNEPIGEYYFDGRQLKRWKVDESNLPAECRIDFKDTGPWSLYKREIIAGAAVLLFQGGLITILLLNRMRLKRMQQKLEQSEATLQSKNKDLSNSYQSLAQSEEELRRLYERLSFISLHDLLTGVYNRTFFEEEVRRLANLKDAPVGIFVADLDGLKLINDTLGHRCGDNLLKKAADILNDGVSKPDFTARIGGDEFAVVVFGASFGRMEERLTKYVAALEEYNAQNKQLPLSLSLGWAISDAEGGFENTFKAADHNMYRQKIHQQQSSRSAIVQTMMKALEARDGVTENHASRLGLMVEKMGQWLHFSQASIADLRLFAKFHDIGKVGIPDEVLNKPGKLTPEETVIMRRHCEIGHRIAKASPDLEPIAELVLKHHEYWDGSGYPFGLRGEEIPLACRLMALIDAFDAMTSDRPYRKAMSKEEAIIEIRRCTGTQFDPVLAEKFIEMIEQ